MIVYTNDNDSLLGADDDNSVKVTNNFNNSTIRTVKLYGSEIVSLTINGQERLCLAQISNTLLDKYSYNEIHNRRVALGITCVQCTPVQLDQLRRAGAMPISSRRCGMITKREAERLVKSFLDEILPPKLPMNFMFNVRHNCGWGGVGSFIPARYNSSRAKCIKCQHCQMFFSPNKFIFHCHKPDLDEIQRNNLTYHHPDAANFNAWRRHLVLSDDTPHENIIHAWEDVKAMFNGGNRKRLLHQQNVDNQAANKAASIESPAANCEINLHHKQIWHNQYNYNFKMDPETNQLPLINNLINTFELNRFNPNLFCENMARKTLSHHNNLFNNSKIKPPNSFINPPWSVFPLPIANKALISSQSLFTANQIPTIEYASSSTSSSSSTKSSVSKSSAPTNNERSNVKKSYKYNIDSLIN